MKSKIPFLRHLHRAFFTLFFGVSVFFTVVYYDYIPTPIELAEEAREQWAQVPLPVDSLREGDLILRHGRGLMSDMLMNFSTAEAKYSHAGVIHFEGDEIMVMHSIDGGENANNRMRKEPLALFCHPQAIFSFGIFRFDLDSAQMAVFDSLIQLRFQQQMEFDVDFDLNTDDKMYCSEIIYKSLLVASQDENYIPLSRTADKAYVAIDNLYLNPHCKKIFEYHYE
jgi:hypothetical protein